MPDFKTLQAAARDAQSLDQLRPAVDAVASVRQAALRDPKVAEACLKLAHQAVGSLHRLIVEGKVANGDASRAVFAAVEDCTSAVQGAPKQGLSVALSSLRVLLGDGRRALTELQQLAEQAPSPRDRLTALKQLLAGAVHLRELAAAWQAMTLVDQAMAAGEPSALEQAAWLRHRASVMIPAGALEEAGRSLDAAKAAIPAAGDTRLLRQQIAGSEIDLLMSFERYEAALAAADAMAAAADTLPDPRQRANLIRGLARVRLGRDGEAEPLLAAAAVANHPKHAPRARVELGLLMVRRGDRAAARMHLAEVLSRPAGQLDDHELNAAAWLSLADMEAGDPSAVAPAELAAALSGMLDWNLTQWAATPTSIRSVAFLQLAVRRDLLAALFAINLRSSGEKAVESCVDAWLRVDALGSRARASGLTPLRFADIRADLVGAGGALVAYLPALHRSWAMVIESDGATLVPLRSDAELRRNVRRLREVLANGSSSIPELQAAAAPVADWCLPAELRPRLLAVQTIAFVGRELVTGVPFECLPWQDSWLGCAKAVSLPPSITLLHADRQRPRGPRRLDVAVVGGAEPEPDALRRHRLSPIPVSPAELGRIADALPPARRSVLPAATAADLNGVGGAESVVCVVVAHGIIDPERQVRAGLLLAGAGGEVFAEQLTATAEIAFLACCEAGQGSTQRGEDDLHRLSGAFALAGSRAVILADGGLSLAPTMALARAFVARLAAGATAAEALRGARCDVAAMPGFEHPHHYCQLRLEGDGELRLPVQPAVPAPSRLGLLLAGGAAAFVALVVWRARRRRA